MSLIHINLFFSFSMLRMGKLLIGVYREEIHMRSLKATIIDPAGMHARPAAVLAKEASQFKSDIEMQVNNQKANVKSIMALLAMGILEGTEIEVRFVGADEDTAYDQIKDTLITSLLANI